jgi:hypothetical protein
MENVLSGALLRGKVLQDTGRQLLDLKKGTPYYATICTASRLAILGGFYRTGFIRIWYFEFTYQKIRFTIALVNNSKGKQYYSYNGVNGCEGRGVGKYS